MKSEQNPRAIKMLIACDLVLLGVGVLLVRSVTYSGLGWFFCAAAIGLLLLVTRPRLFKFYLIAWLLAYVILALLVGRYYRGGQGQETSRVLAKEGEDV